MNRLGGCCIDRLNRHGLPDILLLVLDLSGYRVNQGESVGVAHDFVDQWELDDCVRQCAERQCRRFLKKVNACMPIRSVNLTEVEARALRELLNRFPASELTRQAALNAVKTRCARLAGPMGRNEVAVLRKESNRIDVMHRDEYLRDHHKNLWDS